MGPGKMEFEGVTNEDLGLDDDGYADDGVPEEGEDEDGGPGVREGTHVPLADHITERKRRQHAETQLADQSQRMAVYEDRFQQIQNRFSQQQQDTQAQQYQQQVASAAAQNPEPDRDDTPGEWLMWKVGQLEGQNNQLRELAKSGMESHANMNASAQRDHLRSQVSNFQNDFARQTPDYDQAIRWIEDTRLSQLQVMFPNANQQQLINSLDREKEMIIFGAMKQDQNGNPVIGQFAENPAKRAYDLAVKMGFREAQAAANAQAQQASQTGQHIQQPGQAVGVPLHDRANMAAAGYAGRMGSPAGAPTGEGLSLTMENIAQMSAEEFNELLEHNPDGLDRALGK